MAFPPCETSREQAPESGSRCPAPCRRLPCRQREVPRGCLWAGRGEAPGAAKGPDGLRPSSFECRRRPARGTDAGQLRAGVISLLHREFSHSCVGPARSQAVIASPSMMAFARRPGEQRTTTAIPLECFCLARQ